MQNIVVTGGAGFIGGYLVNKLLRDGSSRVVVIDNFSTGVRTNLHKHPRLEVIKTDILSNIDKYFSGVDVVYHLAALTRPRWSFEYPEETNRVNVEGTLRILKCCVDNKVGKLVFTSSASVYGKQHRLTLSENMKPRPTSPYALTKQIGEKYCGLFAKLYGLRYDIIRPFNVYGPKQSLQGEYSAVVSNFIDRLKNGKKPYISGNGKQVRDFIYVDDVARLMSLLGKRNGSGKIFNAGSGKSTSINDLYEMTGKLMKKKIKPEYKDPVEEPETKANINKAKKLLDWKPQFSLEEGLGRTIKETL